MGFEGLTHKHPFSIRRKKRMSFDLGKQKRLPIHPQV